MGPDDPAFLLPHGYEGAGPEHSSARIERFIQLGSEGNIRLANPTTARSTSTSCAARRESPPRPLVVFTPKAVAPPGRVLLARGADLGTFRFVLDDPRVGEDRDKIDRLVLCSGKLFYDIDQHERRESATSVALGRVELLYPFARNELERLINAYPNLKKIVWAQEEPKNMGAWSVMARRLPS